MSKETIVLSLISHTNIGKTTLTRTLLKRDVGEVRDAAHVTEESERFTLVENSRESLVIWDTPGFGNVNDLLKRMKQEGGALGWVMHEVVDRAFNRSLYSSVAAARNVRSEADVVLYLVNAKEHPADAGYVGLELELLEAMDKPVVMILNQVRRDLESGKVTQSLEQEWRQHYQQYKCLRGVLLLDAFTRSWLQELRLMDEINPLLSESKQKALARLRRQFAQQWQHIFEACSDAAVATWLFARNQKVESSKDEDPKKIFAKLLAELQTRLDGYLDSLVKQHGIEAQGRARLVADIQQVTGNAQKPLSEERSGLLAGAVSSAGAGLMADILSGGMTLGGGAILGFLGGYLGGFSYARVLNMFRKGGPVSWQKSALLELFKLLLSYYLLAALHGRGKGRLDVDERVPMVSEALERNWEDIAEPLTNLMDHGWDQNQQLKPMLLKIFEDAVSKILADIYGDSKTEG
jgi:GTPase Era involved in 16S rRNA processing